MKHIDHRRRRLRRAAGWLATVLSASVVAALAGATGALPTWLCWLLPILAWAPWHPFMRSPGGVPVLMYHSVSGESGWLPWARGISVSPRTFDRQMEKLRRWGFTALTASRLVEARRQARPLPRDAVVITLDDGYLDNWVAAVPILARHGLPATIFVSLDFIEPEAEPRPTLDDLERGRAGAVRWEGYMSWSELRRVQQGGVVEIQAHGVGHGRVPTGPRVVDRLTAQNWRRLAWVQWAQMPGPKWDWHRHSEPPRVGCGAEVPQSAPALAARRWHDGRLESPEEFDRRVRDELARSREVLEREIGHAVRVFCWPQHGYCERGRELAREVGYWATVDGPGGENRDVEDPELISRVHVGEGELGWPSAFGDDLALYAKLRVHQGNYYWYLVLGAIHAVRRVALWTRPRGAFIPAR